MGLELLIWTARLFLEFLSVTIPRGGLGTIVELEIKDLFVPQSPSHTVGLEPELRPDPAYSPEEYVSPSHTVGLELIITVRKEPRGWTSPSHTVGLEHIYCLPVDDNDYLVSIPHGGLGTLERLRDYVRKVKKSVAIPHSGLGTCLSFFGMFG